MAYLKAARVNGVPAALEVSRSGVGAHAWIFFTGAVPAALARRLGMCLLREAMGVRGRMSLASYDRLFPAQDVLPAGGFGNLIAAPLQGRCRRSGTTVFLDLATMEPHEDQWAYLSTVDRMTPREVSRVAGRLREPAVGVQVERLTGTTATRIQVPVPAVVHVSVGSRVTVTGGDLTPAMASTLMHAASLRNPLFDERQRQRRSTWDVPRFLRSYDETVDGDLVLPRGMLALVESLVAEQGSRLDLTDKRADGSPIELEFRGVLHDVQVAALQAIAAHELGVFVAPPGAGKTVVALAAAARAGWPTLVLVDRKTLADQWRAQIFELLGVKAGQLGGGRTKRGGVVDVAMLQTLARRDDVAELTASYGLVIVDECHHVPAVAFEDVVRQIPARRWLGLTATPYRRDRLDDLIALQLGPIRHTIISEAPSTGQLPVEGVVAAPDRRLVVHHTSYWYHGDADPGAPGGMAAIYRDLVADDDRLAHVVDGVAEAMSRGRHCMLLTQWTAHVDQLAAELTDREYDPVVLIGGMGARARAAALARLDPGVGGSSLLVVATGPYVGEGFDCPALDTLFLAAPISFYGRLVQYAGRVLRPWPGKEVAEVHDYVDVGVPVLASSMAKRARGYTSLGFPAPSARSRGVEFRSLTEAAVSRNTLPGSDIAKPVVHSGSGQVVYRCPMSAGISGRSRADLAQLTGHGRRFVTVADAADSLRVERPEAARRLARWAEQGWLRRVRRDLYIPVPIDTVNPAGWGADPLVLADAVWGPCYATGWTAANHWGLTEQSFRTTVVKTVQRVRRTDQRLLDNDFLVAHTSPELLTWGMKREWREERRIQIADPARTVIDALDDLRLVGGVRLATEILAAYLDAHDPDTLVSYGDRLGNRTVFKRIGLLGEVTGASPGLLADCESRLSAGFPMLDQTQPPAGIRSQRWRLLVNARIDDLEPS